MISDRPIPRELENLVENELAPGERVVWLGMPTPRYFTADTLPLFLFAIPWTAFACFWMLVASGFRIPDFSHPEALFPLFGLPFLLVGFGMLSSPYWGKRKMLKTIYAITDRRAIILVGGRRTTIRSYRPEQLTSLSRAQKPDGSANIIFEEQWIVGHKGRTRVKKLGFFGIPNAKEVEDLLRQLADKAR